MATKSEKQVAIDDYVRAQQAMGKAIKNSTNPHFQYFSDTRTYRTKPDFQRFQDYGEMLGIRWYDECNSSGQTEWNCFHTDYVLSK